MADFREPDDKSALDFSKRECVERWLADKPREVAVAFAARAMLRVAPMMQSVAARDLVSRVFLSDNGSGDKYRNGGKILILPIFRAAAASWTAGRYPARGAELRAGAYDVFRSASTAASTAASEHVPAASPVFAVAAHSASASASASSAASAAAAVAVAASANPAATLAFATDAAALIDREASAAVIASLPLWPTEVPSSVRQAWDQLERILLTDNEDWKVWTEWYRARLEGGRSDEALEVARVMIAEEIWRQGPRAANAEIARLIERHQGQSPSPLSDIPSPFGFAWTDAGTIRIVSSSADWPVLPLPTSEKDHHERLDVCRILAKDMISVLKAGRYQTRGEYLEGLKTYVSRLPKAPGDGSILLADAAARTLRSLFAAEVNILSAGFAAQLKTFLEHHIGLRPFYPEVGQFYRDVQSGHIEAPLPQDAVEGFIQGLRNHTPAMFDLSVADAVEVCAEPAPEIAPPSQVSPSESNQPEPPPDPLKELDPRKAHDFMIGGFANGLWKVFLEGDKMVKAAEGWHKASEALQPHVAAILAWLRSYLSTG